MLGASARRFPVATTIYITSHFVSDTMTVPSLVFIYNFAAMIFSAKSTSI